MNDNIPDWVQKEADNVRVLPLDVVKAERVLAKLQVLNRERHDPLALEALEKASARFVIHDDTPPEQLNLTHSDMHAILQLVEAEIAQSMPEFSSIIEQMIASKRYEVAQFQSFIKERLTYLGNPNNQDGIWRDDTLSDAVFRFTRAYANKFGRPLFAATGGLNLVGDPDIDQNETPLDDIIIPPKPRPTSSLEEESTAATGERFDLNRQNPDYDYEYYTAIPYSGGLNDQEQKFFQTALRHFHYGAADNFKGRMERLETFANQHLTAQTPTGLSSEYRKKANVEATKKAKRVVEREWAIQTKFDGALSTVDTPDIVLHKQLMPAFEEQEKRRAAFLKFVDDKITAHTNEYMQNIDSTPVMETDVKRISEIAMENRNRVMSLYDRPLQVGQADSRKHNWEIFKSIFEEYNALHPDTPAPVAQQQKSTATEQTAVERLANRPRGSWLDSFRIGGA